MAQPLRPCRLSHRAAERASSPDVRVQKRRSAVQPAAIAMPVCALTPPNPTAGRAVTPACAAPVARLGSRYEVGSSGAAPRRGLSGAKYQDCAARAMLAANTAAEGMRERVSAQCQRHGGSKCRDTEHEGPTLHKNGTHRGGGNGVSPGEEDNRIGGIADAVAQRRRDRTGERYGKRCARAPRRSSHPRTSEVARPCVAACPRASEGRFAPVAASEGRHVGAAMRPKG